MTQLTITLIGCGKMGSAMIQGWITAGLIKRTKIIDPYEIDDSLSNHPDLFHVKHLKSVNLKETDAIILATKPQVMDSICAELSSVLPENIPILSIAAGKDTHFFYKYFPRNTPLIRAMPNTPASIGKGMTALYATAPVTEKQKSIAADLFTALGQIMWITGEKQMNAVTALSGSGPAYLFYMIEAMARAGETIGMSKDQATELARQTIIGAAALAETESGTPASVLRQNVTSPGGTTEAALKILMNGQFQGITNEAVQAAKKRGEELAD